MKYVCYWLWDFFLSLTCFFPFSVLILPLSLSLSPALAFARSITMSHSCLLWRRELFHSVGSVLLSFSVRFLLFSFYLKHYFCARCDIHFSMFNSIVMWNLRSYAHVHIHLYRHMYIFVCVCVVRLCMYVYVFIRLFIVKFIFRSCKNTHDTFTFQSELSSLWSKNVFVRNALSIIIYVVVVVTFFIVYFAVQCSAVLVFLFVLPFAGGNGERKKSADIWRGCFCGADGKNNEVKVSKSAPTDGGREV